MRCFGTKPCQSRGESAKTKPFLRRIECCGGAKAERGGINRNIARPGTMEKPGQSEG